MLIAQFLPHWTDLRAAFSQCLWHYTGGRRNIATKRMRPGPGIWKSGKFEIQKNTNIKNLEIKIRSAQNVGKVWIRREKNSSRAHLGPFEAIVPWAEKMQKLLDFFLFSLVGQWALFTRFGESAFKDL